jgi:surface-anchored protein
MSIFKHRSLAASLLAAVLLFTTSASAQAVYTAGHGDIGVEYEDGDFLPHWHIHAGGTVDGAVLGTDGEYEPGDLVARIETTSTVSNSGVASALGVSTGATVFRTGITAYPPNLGFGLEELAPGDWLDDTITISLTEVSGPGEVALSQTVSGFGTFVWFSSVSGGFTVNNNAWDFAVGGHQHLDWFFTEAGYHELTFSWTGTHLTEGLVTGSGTFGFQVGAIPESSAFALLAGAFSLGLVVLRRPRHV